jgi:Divergent InlB B-repeat domain
VTLTAVADSGSRFVGWSGGGCSGTEPCTVTMGEARSVTATFALIPPPPPSAVDPGPPAPPEPPTGPAPTTPHAPMLTVSTRGKGSVSSKAPGIDCPSASCRHAFAEAEIVELRAAPRHGWRFAGWSGACKGSHGTCRVTMSEARTVTARFVGVATLALRLPRHLVLHLPYEHATVVAAATWAGRPLAHSIVTIVTVCEGTRVVRRLRTDAKGRISFAFGATMHDRNRVVRCSVAGRFAAQGQVAAAAGTVGFMHPLWLRSLGSTGDGTRIRIFGRAGHLAVLHAGGATVATVRIGRHGWVDVVTRAVRSGSRIFVTSPDGHSSHVVTA